MSVGMLDSFTHYWDDNWQDQSFITAGKYKDFWTILIDYGKIPNFTHRIDRYINTKVLG